MTSKTIETELDLEAVKAALGEIEWALSTFAILADDETADLDDEHVVRLLYADPEYDGEDSLLGERFMRAFRKASAAFAKVPTVLAAVERLAALSRAPGAEELGSSTRMTSPASRSPEQLSAGEEHLRLAMNGVKAALPILYTLRDRQQNVETWGLVGRIAALEAARNFSPPADTTLSGPQRSEVALSAQDRPPSSVGGEGEAVALKTSGWAALAQNRNIRLWSADFDTVHAFAMFNGCEVVRLVSPSPEMGETSREELEGDLNKVLRLQVDALIGEVRTLVPQNYDGWDYHGRHWTDRIAKRATDEILKLKENGLSREGLGGSARASRGAAGPSDCAEGDARLSDGGRG